MNTKTTWFTLSTAMVLLAGSALLSGCSTSAGPAGSPPVGAQGGTEVQGNGGIVGAQAVQFGQIEELSRPAINEGLFITNDFLNAFNATLPAQEGAALAAVAALKNEAVTTLVALASTNANEVAAGDVTQRALDEVVSLIPDVQRIDDTLNVSPIGSAAYAGEAIADAVAVNGGAAQGTSFVVENGKLVLFPGTIAARQIAQATPGFPVVFLRNGRKLEDDVIDSTLVDLTGAEFGATEAGSTQEGVNYISTDAPAQGHQNLNAQVTSGTNDANEFTVVGTASEGTAAVFPFAAPNN